MNWFYFPYFYLATTLLWVIAIVCLFFKKKSIPGFYLSVAGLLLILSFTVILWILLDRPPMRTLGETRLWYSVFMPVIGIIIFKRWNYRWFLQYCLAMALVFLTINYFETETHEKTLMPALQSVWFVPHVIVYILAYALLAASSLVAISGLYNHYKKRIEQTTIVLADNLVYIGFSLLTLGLVFGALWAKEAWGDYWTWDPKETWALITWLAYMLYIHFRYYQPKSQSIALLILAISFVLLLVCWFGLKYLPTAHNSVHIYTN